MAVKAKVRTVTRESSNRLLPVLIHRLNPMLRGWANYHRHGRQPKPSPTWLPSPGVGCGTGFATSTPKTGERELQRRYLRTRWPEQDEVRRFSRPRWPSCATATKSQPSLRHGRQQRRKPRSRQERTRAEPDAVKAALRVRRAGRNGPAEKPTPGPGPTLTIRRSKAAWRCGIGCGPVAEMPD
jgi:hypothetical protein